jgi:hypothetical protein
MPGQPRPASNVRSGRRQGLPESPWRWHSVCRSCRAWRTGLPDGRDADRPGAWRPRTIRARDGRQPGDHPAGSGDLRQATMPGNVAVDPASAVPARRGAGGAVARPSAPCYREPVTLSETGGLGRKRALPPIWTAGLSVPMVPVRVQIWEICALACTAGGASVGRPLVVFTQRLGRDRVLGDPAAGTLSLDGTPASCQTPGTQIFGYLLSGRSHCRGEQPQTRAGGRAGRTCRRTFPARK